MPESIRLDGLCNEFELVFVERVATPERMMKLGIHLYLAVLSPFNTVSMFDDLGGDRAPSTGHNWVQKANPEPRAGRDLDKIALDETVVELIGERFWLNVEVDPKTNVILHVRPYPTRKIVITKRFLWELREKHSIDDAEFFDDGTPWLQAGLHELEIHFRHKTHGNRKSG